MVHGTCTNATRHARPRGIAARRTRRAGGAQVARTRGKGHADAQVVPRGRAASK